MTIQKGISKQYLYALIVFIIVLIILWSILTGDIARKEISVAFLSALGTFLGALFAFRLNESKDYTKLQDERRLALSRALFTLARQRDAVTSIVKLLDPFKTEIERAFNLPAYQPPQYSDLKQNFEALEFLLESADSVNTLMQLVNEQERFHQCIESLRTRNDFYINELQLQLEKHNLTGRDVYEKELREKLGERIFGTSMHYAENLYFHFYEAEKTLKFISLELFNVAKKQFPKNKFLIHPDDIPSIKI